MNASKKEREQTLVKAGIIAVIRAKGPEQVVPLSRALLAGGVSAIEVTMTTPNALSAIRSARAELSADALIGVGTVLDERTCSAALEAGAQFVVSPVCRTSLVPVAHAANMPIMLGAYTPTEAQAAFEGGADFIKVFPAETLGPAYIKALRAPLPHLRIVPTGGVDVGNIADFFKAGCAAVGVGGSLISAKILEQNDWAELTRRARQFVEAMGSAAGRPQC